MGKYIDLTQDNFEATVNSGVSLVDFWAPWCGPCRMVAPVVEELAKEYDGKALVGKVDVDNNQDVSVEYGIRNIPTILFFKGGQVVDKVVGVVPKEKLAEKIDALL